MKKLISIFAILFSVLFLSCETNVSKRNSGLVIYGKSFEIIEYQGCEYLVSGVNSDSAVMCHKGNCKNPIHCCK